MRFFQKNAGMNQLKNNQKNQFYAAIKPLKIWDGNVDAIVISKLVKRKTNSKYLIGDSGKAIRPLVLIMPKISGCLKAFKVKDGDKNKNYKLIPFGIDDEKLLKNCKAIWTKIEDLKNIEPNALPANHDRYVKPKIRTYGDKVYTNFCSLQVPKNDIDCVSFRVIFIDSLLVYEKKYYLQVHLGNCVYEIVNQ